MYVGSVPMLFCIYFRITYAEIFGGVTLFTPQQFRVVNGFSNEFYGWGGEDDDMFNRLVPCARK